MKSLSIIYQQFFPDFTPTVGLGCRSGGYVVYLIIAAALLLTEILIWWLTHKTTHTENEPLA